MPAARNDVDLTTDAGLDGDTLGDRKGTPLQTRSSASGFVISPYDIVIFSFTPANSGTDANPAGIHGKFEFRVTPPDTRTSAYSSGTITASPVSNDVIVGNPLTAYTLNGILYVSGLKAGEKWSVYNILGTLIYTGIFPSNGGAGVVEIPLPNSGIYIITNGKNTLKIMNR